MIIHTKTSGAGAGAALGVMIVAILHSIPGVHLAPEANATIPAFLSILASWLAPGEPASPPAQVHSAPVPGPARTPNVPPVPPTTGGTKGA